jgi:tetratricopeptide (TPR) repeat protein
LIAQFRPPQRCRLFGSIALCSFLLTGSGYAREPLYPGLGSYTRKATTDSPLAQRYFNQGLAWLHGFNHAAAIRSFEEAAKLDPECAIAHWGIALAAGPHINDGRLPPAMAELAWNELALARRASRASEVERALIDALGHRYANPEPRDRSPLHVAYADAMREVWSKYSNDPDVGAFFAESMMDLRPWGQWTPDGQPSPGTEEIIATLTSVLRLAPKHPFANHLYIHALEMSPHPEQADAAAKRLRDLEPGLAHMVHMPSHIDIRRGRWHEAIVANTKAIEADKRYRTLSASQPLNFMAVYAAHNQHMLAYAALMTGQSALALRTIRQMVADLPPKYLDENAPFLESFVALPMEVMVRFGKWDDILAEADSYPDYAPFTRAFHYAARAVAFAAKNDAESARKEQAVFADRALLVPKTTSFGNNDATTILSLVQLMVEGEILVSEGKVDDGLAHLRDALQVEDSLGYDEPPSWMIPLRHLIGATLMGAGRFGEAEQVYREDLRRLPDNGWSLQGLLESLERQNKNPDERRALATRFRRTWAKADLSITSSCLCQPRR